ncbi:cytochrome c-type biogenesis protein CcmH [Silvibacterium bohemicum]|uniref:Cytochrome c-type biogenesis protein n=1 Tax=Silvibacterium bohemicum TaxID=1577686 RepID=A0A841K0T6_9BACT|nr:cytochrome c-type biogenesis protein CcmH [Silvibacterium bohemicum]MBB6143854.1 cytochrome c-type biogenesis protein CcmH [Silvibacterium bohemicum]
MRLLRLSQMGLVALLVLVSTGASDTAARYNALGHSMMCVCGCNQVLMGCNHVGCPDSHQMLAELRVDVSRGDANTPILKAFQAEYGPTVLAAPMFTRFNDAAWFAPPLVLLLGIAAIVILVRKWRLHTVATPAEPGTPALIQIRDQIRKETEL